MIDTSKYEGHTPGPWWMENGFIMGNDRDDAVHISETLEILEGNEADARLAADAPLLLEEVQRLRKGLKMMLDDMKFSKPEEEIEYWLDTWKHWLKELIE